jgi:hypothetical protein
VPDDHAPADHPPRLRGRRLSIAGVIGVLILGLAAPASALLPMLDEGPGPADSYWTPDPGPVNEVSPGVPTPEQQPPAPTPAPPPQDPSPSPAAPAPPALDQATADAQLSQALRDARAALANPDCAALIGRWPNNYPTGLTALDVLDTIAAALNPRQLANDWTGSNGDAWAAGGPLGSGPAGSIEVYRRFHEARPGVEYTLVRNGETFVYTLEDTYNTYSRDYIYSLTAEEFRALAVLHELRHVQGSLDGNHNGSLAAANEAIIDACFPNARRQPNPTYDATHITAPPEPIPLALPPLDNGTGGGGGGGAGPVENPHGSDPRIIVDGTELDGGYYSDDPVIRGEDGSVVDGGTVGPYPDPPEESWEPPYEDPCYPDGCYDPYPGEPYDPGYGGGGIGGGGGGVWYPENDDGWWYLVELGY